MEITRYEHGVPSWVDLGTHDLAGSLRFYTSLFGWDTEDMGAEAGHYTVVSKNGKAVAALSAGQEDPGPPRWTAYVNVDDVDEVAARAASAGGTVVAPPVDVMTAGRMAILQDPTGATIAVWQPREHMGAALVNEAGAFSWCELATSDLGRSKDFYARTFGWGWGGSDEYAEAQVGGRTIAGVLPRPAEMPAAVPDHWLVYFGTTDVDTDVKRATELGASVVVQPMDIPGTGRFSVLADPQGAMFALFQG